jgi:GT2 family glycosyltransferase
MEPRAAGRTRSSLDPDRNATRAPWILAWHFPHFLKRLAPPFVVRALSGLKKQILTRDFSPGVEFEQSPDDAQASSLMSIVVPIHDAPEITRRCLASLERYAPQAEVILVDDGSKLPETAQLFNDFGGRAGWKVVRHETPLGHSQGCADGVALATRPYLCLLNSDTVVTPWCWRRIAEAFQRDPSIGIAGPSTSIAATPQALTLAANLSAHWNDNQICAFANRLLTEFQVSAITDLPWVSGFAFFIRRDLWEQLGGFDPKIPDYGNEFELCSRAAAGGCRIVWIRNAYIHHFGGQSYLQTIGEEGIRAQVQAADTYIKQKNRSPAP